MAAKKQKKKIEIFGGFHNAYPIIVKVPADFDLYQYGIESLLTCAVSNNTAKKIRKHMCGISGCMCGVNGWQIRDKD